MRGKPRIIRNKMLAKANNASPKGAFRLSAAERKKYNRMTDKEDKMNLRIALAGNPNSGKTTLFNALTGSNQFVGNWPGVTVEKKEGSIKGIIARGGFELDLSWKNGKVSRLVVKSYKGGNCRLRSLNPLTGNGLKRAKGENPNPLYAVPTIPEPLINEKANLNKVEIAETYLYDLPTKAGKEYVLIGK